MTLKTRQSLFIRNQPTSYTSSIANFLRAETIAFLGLRVFRRIVYKKSKNMFPHLSVFPHFALHSGIDHALKRKTHGIHSLSFHSDIRTVS